jgi:hypothetical protein
VTSLSTSRRAANLWVVRRASRRALYALALVGGAVCPAALAAQVGNPTAAPNTQSGYPNNVAMSNGLVIVRPIGLSTLHTLDFGKLNPGGNSSFMYAGNAGSGLLKVTGDLNTRVYFTAIYNALTGPASHTLSFVGTDLEYSSTASYGGPFTYMATDGNSRQYVDLLTPLSGQPGFGVVYIWVGGQIFVDAAAPRGVYTGSIAIGIDYN